MVAELMNNITKYSPSTCRRMRRILILLCSVWLCASATVAFTMIRIRKHGCTSCNSNDTHQQYADDKAGQPTPHGSSIKSFIPSRETQTQLTYSIITMMSKHNSARNDDANDSSSVGDVDFPAYPNVEVLRGNNKEGSNNRNDLPGTSDRLLEEEDGEGQEDWLPDREKARQWRQQQESVFASATDRIMPTTTSPTPYTEEEEDIIAAMGGKTSQYRGQQQPRQEPVIQQRRREEGFLGDSTLQEIATDYSVPVMYLADVLCMWGVPVPINVQDRLGDLVTGEQAFAILEAVNSLDVSALQDRYSNQSLINLCKEWDINLAEAFDMAVSEGWSLPFGVHTCLRVEHEDELLRVLGGSTLYANSDDDEDHDEYFDD